MLISGSALRRLCLARDLLRESPAETVSIKDIARHAGMSPFHFIRQFESVYGTTPHQYRIQSRVELAKRLLAAGEHSVTEVCMEVGFSSLGSFSDLFTRRVGRAPSAFQREARLLVRVPGRLPLNLFPGCLSLMSCLPVDALRNFREAS